MYVKKNHQFLISTKKTRNKENWFLFCWDTVYMSSSLDDRCCTTCRISTWRWAVGRRSWSTRRGRAAAAASSRRTSPAVSVSTAARRRTVTTTGRWLESETTAVNSQPLQPSITAGRSSPRPSSRSVRCCSAARSSDLAITELYRRIFRDVVWVILPIR